MNLDDIVQYIPNQISHSSDGIKMIDAPIGNEEFCETFWGGGNLVQKIRESVSLIRTWRDTQRAFCLFRLCIATTTNYFSRMTSSFLSYSSSITAKIENLLKDGIAFLIGRIQDVGG